MNAQLRDAIIVYNVLVLLYFLLMNYTYLFLLFMATKELFHYRMRREIGTRPLDLCITLPAITIISPAHNEAVTIVESVQSLLALDYPNLEILVVNDGSTDKTLEVLKEKFRLFAGHRVGVETLKTKSIMGIYRTALDPRLVVIDKENGGKADSLNAGLNYSRSPLFCAIDADTLIERDALRKLVASYLERTEKVVALGGLVRVANNCETRDGQVVDVKLPRGYLGSMQAMEYIRDFLCGRSGWNALNGMLIVSGAFGLFERKTVVEAGGYRTDMVGEDMELVVRLHERMRRQKRAYRIAFIPDPVCWTQVPERLGVFAAQRNRWQRGLLGTLRHHLGMLLNPRYGRIGLLAMPYLVLFEMFGPLVEITGYVVVVISWLLGILNTQFMLFFIGLAFLFGILLSLFSLLLEEFTLRNYGRFIDIVKLLFLAIFENLGYRQLTSLIRLWASVDFFFRKSSWGRMERKPFNPGREPTSAAPPS